MSVGGLVKNERGFIDIINQTETRIYRYKGKTFVISYEGEIYNKNEIRNELISRGNYFDGDEETELLVKGFTNWKERILNKIDGVFVFAIWDVDEKILFLARDPIGAKSMYFSILKDGFIFANHIKHILYSKEVNAEVTYEGITELLSLGPSKRQSSAIFRNIAGLEPGSYLKYSYGAVEIRKYTDFEAWENEENFEEIVDNIRNMVADSIFRQAVDSEEVCTLLSGGLDSSIVTAVTAEVLKEAKIPLKTFSIGYEENESYFESNIFQPNSDDEWVKKMVSFLYTDHRDVVLTNDDLIENLREAMLARGFPGMGDIDSSLLVFCKRMKRFCNIGLGGECADEVFGGYPWFHRNDLLNSDFFPWIRSVEERSEFINPEVRENVDAVKFAKDIYFSEVKKAPKLLNETDKEQKIREVGYLTYRWFLPVLLERQDRMAGRAGFKIRAPFCNYELMQYMYNVPWEYRNYNNMEKGILRYAFRDLLPKEVAERKKSPFPKTYNPEYRKLVVRELNHILDNPTAPIKDIIDIDRVKRLINEDEENYRPWFGQLMKGPQVMAFLIQVNEWMKEYKVTLV